MPCKEAIVLKDHLQVFANDLVSAEKLEKLPATKVNKLAFVGLLSKLSKQALSLSLDLQVLGDKLNEKI